MTGTAASSFEQFMTRRLAASTAFVQGDVGPLIEISAASSPATIFGPAGTAVQGWEQVNAANAGGAGTLVSLDNTGWWTLDAKGTCRPFGLGGAHVVSFGGLPSTRARNSFRSMRTNW